MKTKIFPVLIVITLLLIAGIVYFTQKKTASSETAATRAKIVTPRSQNSEEEIAGENRGPSFQTETFDSFIELLPTETLISSLPVDFNNDGFEDEVDIIRKAGTQSFFIVPGLYNQLTGDYERLSDIPTNISKTRTFSYTGMDVTGQHKTTLVFQGVADDGNYIMKLYQSKTEGDKTELYSIGDFVSDGTIFIQQTERSESYELSMAKGESFSVWIYKSEKDEATQAVVNQIQQEYKWNPAHDKYELDREIKVAASRLAKTELSKILDGTVETFANFLNGLWYKTSNDTASIRYLYFDYDTREIILLVDDSQEVYEWEDSKLRHNGVYLSTVNTDISNLQRRFDINLVSTDEIKITIWDVINLSIKESSLWDGEYKKLNLQSTFEDNQNSGKAAQLLKEIETSEEWKTIDKAYTISLKDGVYKFTSDVNSESGIFSVMDSGTYSVIQFRSNSDNSQLNQTYSMEFGTKVISETVKKQTVEKIVTDYDTVIFTPVKLTPTDCFAAEGKSFTFVKNWE